MQIKILFRFRRLIDLFILIVFSIGYISATEKTLMDLISRMSLAEKIGQLNQLNARTGIEEMKNLVREGKVGSILNANVNHINELQKIAVEESLNRIPLIFARDVIHGYKTIFPIPLGQAATFNPEIVRLGGRVAAEEASSQGIRWTFAPMIDVSHDPRWGRIAESFGEDPYLSSVLGVAMTEGFQGENLSDKNTLAACAKHFAGYGASEGGRDYNSTNIPERLLRNLYLPPFEEQVKAGVATFMTSFNDNDGIPMTANNHTNQQILRKEWGFDGVVVSDWAAIKEMIKHGFTQDLKDAAHKAILAGVDVDMMSFAYSSELEKVVLENPDIEKTIDQSVLRVLELKKKLGLFENAYTKDSKDSVLYAPSHLAAAKKAADESIVLLKNESNVLPVKDNVRSIAIFGPMADAPHDQLGTWIFDGEKSRTQTPLQSLKRLYGDKVTFYYEKTLDYTRDNNTINLSKAVSIAKKCDLVLLFVGEESMLSGEAHCLANINLIGAQSALVNEIARTGKPVVLIVMAGRPLTIEKEFNLSKAVLYAWHPGTMGGDAIADVIFGKVNPSGKLPVTFPRHVGQIPLYYNHNNTGRPAPDDIKTLEKINVAVPQSSLGHTSFYLDYGKDPFLPFGYGLSYTNFNYSALKLNKKILGSKNDSIVVEFDLTNAGFRAGTEVVQLYVRDVVGSITRPVKELKRFSRVTLNPGESQRIQFSLYPDDLAFWGINNLKVIEDGTIQLWVGGNSMEGLMTDFQIITKTKD